MERLLKSKLPGGVFATTEQRSRAMGKIRGHGNRSTELRLRMAFVREGLSGWTTQRRDLPGKPDFYFEAARLAIFVDGCFWHGCARCGHIPKTHQEFWAAKISRNRQRHRQVASMLKREEIQVFRLWEHELRNNIARAVKRIERLVGAQSKRS